MPADLWQKNQRKMSNLNQVNKALIVGIDHYDWAPLRGCVADAKAMEQVLSRHEDGSRNFHCKTVVSGDRNRRVTEAQLRKEIREFFQGVGDIALFYFSGHGSEDNLGGYLVAQDSEKYSLGLPFSELLQVAQQCVEFREIFIILDCCYSGAIPSPNDAGSLGGGMLLPRKGISILTASRPEQYSMERGGRGVFTRILEKGLEGNAADLLGHVTVAGLYHYADRMLGPFKQRPMFKAHVSGFKILRQCSPKVFEEELRRLPDLFASEDAELPLDPSYAPGLAPQHVAHERTYGQLRRLVQAGLVEPLGVDDLADAAKQRKACRLTSQGRAYWSIVKEDGF